MRYHHEDAVRKLREAHRLVAGGVFGRTAQEMQRTRDIRARKILVELLDDPDLSPQARNSLEAARKQLDKAILRLNRTNALMTIADAIDLISGEQDSQAKAG